MADLIDRQAAIEALKPCAGVGNRALDKLRALPSSEPRWIPCSERLPEIGEGVLGCSKGGTVDVIWRTFFSNPPGSWDTNGLIPIEELLAWMPLPKPYEERSEENG